MSLINDFLKSLAIPVDSLAKWLQEEHNVPVNLTIKKWNELSGMNVVLEDSGVTCTNVEDQSIKIATDKPKEVNPTQCLHFLLTGLNKGKQCSIHPNKGNKYCSAHRKVKSKENSPKSDLESDTTKKPKPATKKVIKKKPVSENDKSSDEEEPSKPAAKKVIKSKENSPKSDLESDTTKKPKPATKKVIKKKPVSENDKSSDEEEPPSIFDPDNKEDPTTIAANLPNRIPKKRVSDSSTDDSDSDSDSDDN